MKVRVNGRIDKSIAKAFLGKRRKKARVILFSGDYRTSIDVRQSGAVSVCYVGDDERLGKNVIHWFANSQSASIKVGDELEGLVTRTMQFGAFVLLSFNGLKEGLIHVSKLTQGEVSFGDIIRVKVVEINEVGQVNLSLAD